MDQWTDEWTDEWTDGPINERVDQWTDELTDEWTDEWTDGPNERTNEWVNRPRRRGVVPHGDVAQGQSRAPLRRETQSYSPRLRALLHCFFPYAFVRQYEYSRLWSSLGLDFMMKNRTSHERAIVICINGVVVSCNMMYERGGPPPSPPLFPTDAASNVAS